MRSPSHVVETGRGDRQSIVLTSKSRISSRQDQRSSKKLPRRPRTSGSRASATSATNRTRGWACASSSSSSATRRPMSSSTNCGATPRRNRARSPPTCWRSAAAAPKCMGLRDIHRRRSSPFREHRHHPPDQVRTRQGTRAGAHFLLGLVDRGDQPRRGSPAMIRGSVHPRRSRATALLTRVRGRWPTFAPYVAAGRGD